MNNDIDKTIVYLDNIIYDENQNEMLGEEFILNLDIAVKGLKSIVTKEREDK